MVKKNQYTPKGPYEVQINCEACGVEFTARASNTIFCLKHRGHRRLECLVCKKTFYRRVAMAAVATKTCSKTCLIQLNVVLGITKECEVCKDKFHPHPVAHDKYCKRHRTLYAREKYYKYHNIQRPEPPKEKKNPYKEGVIKDCEAKTHTGCTGKMIVFKNNWTRCGLCVKPHTGRQVVVKQLFTY